MIDWPQRLSIRILAHFILYQKRILQSVVVLNELLPIVEFNSQLFHIAYRRHEFWRIRLQSQFVFKRRRFL